MTHQKNDTQEETESQVSFEEMLREQLQQAIGILLILQNLVLGLLRGFLDDAMSL